MWKWTKMRFFLQRSDSGFSGGKIVDLIHFITDCLILAAFLLAEGNKINCEYFFCVGLGRKRRVPDSVLLQSYFFVLASQVGAKRRTPWTFPLFMYLLGFFDRPTQSGAELRSGRKMIFHFWFLHLHSITFTSIPVNNFWGKQLDKLHETSS